MVLAAGPTVFKSESLVIEHVDILPPLILAENEVKHVQLVLNSPPPQVTVTREVTVTSSESSYAFQIFSVTTPDATQVEGGEQLRWTLHSSGKVRVNHSQPENGTDLQALQAQATEEIDIAAYYQQFREQGIEYGPSFQAISGLWRSSSSGPDKVGATPCCYPSL